MTLPKMKSLGDFLGGCVGGDGVGVVVVVAPFSFLPSEGAIGAMGLTTGRVDTFCKHTKTDRAKISTY